MPWDPHTIPTLFQGPRHNNDNSLLLLVLLLLPPHQLLTLINQMYSLVMACPWNWEKCKQLAYAESVKNSGHVQTISLAPAIKFAASLLMDRKLVEKYLEHCKPWWTKQKGCSSTFPGHRRRFGFSVCTVDTSWPTVPTPKSLLNNKYTVLANDETETKTAWVNLPMPTIKILPRSKKTLKFNPSVKQNNGPTLPVTIPPSNPQKEEMSSHSWKNTIDPWWINWIKQQVTHPDMKEIYGTWKHSSMIPEWLKYLQTLWKIFKKCPPKMLTGLLRIYRVPLDSEKHPLANLEIPLSFPLSSSPMMEHESKLNLSLIWDILDLWFTRILSPNTESKPIPYPVHSRYTMLMVLTIPEAKLRNLQLSIYRSKITRNKSVSP